MRIDRRNEWKAKWWVDSRHLRWLRANDGALVYNVWRHEQRLFQCLYDLNTDETDVSLLHVPGYGWPFKVIANILEREANYGGVVVGDVLGIELSKTGNDLMVVRDRVETDAVEFVVMFLCAHGMM